MLKRTIIASILLISLALLLLLPSPSQAEQRFLVRLIDQYPHLADTKLNDCLVCHAQGVGGGSTNDFAHDYFDNSFSYTKIEDFDSDGDGFTNLEEIMAGTFPGNPNSVPRSAPEPVPAETPTPTLDDLLVDKTSQERATFLYTTYCISCHGEYSQNGRLTNLRHLSSAQESDIRAIITNGMPDTTMSGWGEQAGGPLSDQHIDDLTAMVINWYAPPTPTSVPTVAPTSTITPTPALTTTFATQSYPLLAILGIFWMLALAIFVFGVRSALRK